MTTITPYLPIQPVDAIQLPDVAPIQSEAQRLFERFIPDEPGLRQSYLNDAQSFIDSDFIPRTKKWNQPAPTPPSVYEIALIRYYTDQGYTINAVLSSGEVTSVVKPADLTVADYQALGREIDRILPTLPPEYQEKAIEAAQRKPITLYRGAEPTDVNFETIDTGPLSHPTHWSTTPTLPIALSFAGADALETGKGYIYVLEDTNGTDISTISSFRAEGEYLFPTHTPFIVDHIEWRYIDLSKAGEPTPDAMTYVPKVYKDKSGAWINADADVTRPPPRVKYMPFVYLKPAE